MALPWAILTISALCRQQLPGNLHPQLVCAKLLPRLVCVGITFQAVMFACLMTTSNYLTADTQERHAAISAGLHGASSAAAGDLTVATGTQHLPLEIGAGGKIGGSAAVTGVRVLLS